MVEQTISSLKDIYDFLDRIYLFQKDTKQIASLAEFEKSAGLSKGLISRWKAGSCPSVKKLLYVFSSLDVELVLRSGVESGNVESTNSKIDDDIYKSVQTLLSSSISLDNKKQILNILNSAILLTQH